MITNAALQDVSGRQAASSNPLQGTDTRDSRLLIRGNYATSYIQELKDDKHTTHDASLVDTLYIA